MAVVTVFTSGPVPGMESSYWSDPSPIEEWVPSSVLSQAAERRCVTNGIKWVLALWQPGCFSSVQWLV